VTRCFSSSFLIRPCYLPVLEIYIAPCCQERWRPFTSRFGRRPQLTISRPCHLPVLEILHSSLLSGMMAAIHFQVWTAATINHSPRVSLFSVPMGSKGKPKLAFTGRFERPIFLTTSYATFSANCADLQRAR